MQSFLEPEQPTILRWWPLAALVVGLATVLSVFTGYSEPQTAAASPNPTQQSRILQSVTTLQGRLHRMPNDSLGWAQLGSAYVELARITADPSYYAKAQGVLDKSLALKPEDNGPAMLGLGALANARHDFGAAKEWGLKALAAQPRSAEVFGVLADAYTQLGDEGGAMDAVQNMLDVKPNVASFTRASYFFETHGRIDDARMALDRALAAAGAPDEIAFCRYYLGELAFNSGDLAEADRQFTAASGSCSTRPCSRDRPKWPRRKAISNVLWVPTKTLSCGRRCHSTLWNTANCSTRPGGKKKPLHSSKSWHSNRS